MSAEDKTSIYKNPHKLDSILLTSVSIILLAVYLRTLLPGVGYMGDTAKFQFIGKVLGIPHAPGYPNYILLNHLFVSIFPFGTLAFKANLLSAIYTVIASIFIYKLFRLLQINPWIAASITLTLCLGKTVWIHSVIAEVYTLNLLYTTLVVFLFVKWHLSKQDRFFYLACFFYAISFGNHLLMITLLPGIIYLVYVTDKKTFISPKKILFCAFCIMLGAGQYYYLIWRTLDPSSVYLELRASNFSELLKIVTGGGSRDDVFRLLTPELYLAKIEKFAFFFGRELLFLIPLPVIGFLSKKRNQLYWFVFILFAGSLFFSFNYSIDDIWVYLIPCYFYLSVFSAIGVERIYLWILQKTQKSQIQYFAFLIPLAFFFINLNRADMSKQDQFQLDTEAKLKAMGSNAVLINPDYDEYEYFKYYLLGEGYEKSQNILLMSEDEAKNLLSAPNMAYKIYTTSETIAQDFVTQGDHVLEIMPALYLIER